MQTISSTEQPLVVPLQLVQRNKHLLIILILFLTTLVRLYRIDQPYTDLAGWRQTSVAMMAENFYKHNPNILFPEVSWNGPGESYNGREFQTVSYISSLLYRVVGQHDWVGRLVALLFGVWGVFALYKLVMRIWGRIHALAAATVLAILPGAIFIDRCFLPDPAMVSLATTGVWMLVAYLQSGKDKYLWLTALFAGWGFLSKITGMILLLPMLYATLSILHAQKKLKWLVFSRLLFPGLVVIAVVAAYYLWARHLSLSYPPYHFAGSGNWVWDEGLGNWLQQDYFLYNLGYIFTNWTLGLPVIVLALAGIVILLFAKNGSINSTKYTSAYYAPFLFHFWLLGCIVFYLVGAKELVWNFWNFHIWHPMIAFFCASAILSVFSFFKRWRSAAPVVAIVFLAWIGGSNWQVLKKVYTSRAYKIDHQIGVRVNGLRKPGDLVIVLSEEVGCPVAIYYSKTRGWVFPPAGNYDWDQLPATDAACIATLEDLRQRGAGWFGVARRQYDVFSTSYPQFAQYLNTRLTVAADEPDYVIFKLTDTSSLQ